MVGVHCGAWLRGICGIAAALLFAVAPGLAHPVATAAATPQVAASGTPVVAVDPGWDHICAILEGGTVTCWGDDQAGQARPPDGRVSAVALGMWTTCGLLEESRALTCWGGWGDDEDPEPMATPPDGAFAAISAGSEPDWYGLGGGTEQACALDLEGRLVCWGDNRFHQSLPPEGEYVAVDVGSRHACAIATDATVACWGNDTYGQATPPDGTFRAIAAGGGHTCGVRTDGSVACWGANGAGQSTPPEGSFTAAAAGYRSTCAIRDDHSLACWGDIDGDSVPVGTFKAISGAGWTMCGVRDDGVADCGSSLPIPRATITTPGRYTPATSVQVSWAGRPGLGAVASFDVSWRRAKWNETGSYGMTVTWQSATSATSGEVSIAPGYTYCFRARARDTDGRVSKWSRRACTAAPLDDRKLGASSRWTRADGAAYFQGTVTRTRAKGAVLTRTNVVASHLALVATTCPNCGAVNVYLGSRLLRTVSLVSPTVVDRAVLPVKSWWGEREGTVRIEVVSDGKPVRIDGLAVDRS